jgi:hypothetical protein
MNDFVPRDPGRDTPEEEETTLRTSGQRRINLIWESTQAIIALMTVGGGVLVMVRNAMVGSDAPIPSSLTSMIFLVLGFYFARTNHSNMGGIGPRHHSDERR